MNPTKRICVFCGSSPGRDGVYRAAARDLGREMVARGYGLVFGGGGVGLMGTIADAVMEAGGHATGVIPQALVAREIAHRGLSELEVVSSMHERKQRMAELSDGFIAMPGGLGTLEEICEILTWAQLGIHAKPCGLLDVDGYFAPLLAFLDRTVEEGFLRPEHREIVRVADSPGALLDGFESYRPPKVGKWLDREEA